MLPGSDSVTRDTGALNSGAAAGGAVTVTVVVSAEGGAAGLVVAAAGVATSGGAGAAATGTGRYSGWCNSGSRDGVRDPRSTDAGEPGDASAFGVERGAAAAAETDLAATSDSGRGSRSWRRASDAASDRRAAEAAGCAEFDWVGESAETASSAWATGVAAIAAPVPRATDSAPTRRAARCPLRLRQNNCSPIG